MGIYRTMYLSRRIDDKEIQLKAMNRIFFQISGAGHEAVLTAAGWPSVQAGHDWFYPITATALSASSSASRRLRCCSPRSARRPTPARTAARCPRTGVTPSSISSLRPRPRARSSYRRSAAPRRATAARSRTDARAHHRLQGDEVVYCSSGDGTTSEGEFWEALNTASNSPSSSSIEDNGYAISVPVEVQTAGGDVSRLVEGFPDLLIERCDGTDPVESLETLKRASSTAARGKGPALVHAKVIRPYSHSLSDDEKLYRPDEERTSDAERDRQALRRARGASSRRTSLQKLKDEVDREVNEAADARAPEPAARRHGREHVYSPER